MFCGSIYVPDELICWINTIKIHCENLPKSIDCVVSELTINIATNSNVSICKDTDYGKVYWIGIHPNDTNPFEHPYPHEHSKSNNTINTKYIHTKPTDYVEFIWNILDNDLSSTDIANIIKNAISNIKIHILVKNYICGTSLNLKLHFSNGQINSKLTMDDFGMIEKYFSTHFETNFYTYSDDKLDSRIKDMLTFTNTFFNNNNNNLSQEQLENRKKILTKLIKKY